MPAKIEMYSNTTYPKRLISNILRILKAQQQKKTTLPNIGVKCAREIVQWLRHLS